MMEKKTCKLSTLKFLCNHFFYQNQKQTKLKRNKKTKKI
jgi:hypothetical protein